MAVQVAKFVGGRTTRLLRQMLRPGTADRRRGERCEPGKGRPHIRHWHGEMLEHLIAGERADGIGRAFRLVRLQHKHLLASPQHHLADLLGPQ